MTKMKRMASLLLSLLLIVPMLGVGIVPAAAKDYVMTNGDVVFIPGTAKAGKTIEAYIVASATVPAGEKVDLRMPETTNDNKFAVGTATGRFWEMIDGTLMRVSGIWYAKGEVFKGRWFKFGYHETITALTDDTLQTDHHPYHVGGNKCARGFADACGDASSTTRYFECANKLSIAKDLTIIDLTGNGAKTLAQVKELTDAGKAIINLYVPDGYSESGSHHGHKDGAVHGTAKVVVVQEVAAEGYVIPEEGDVFYVPGTVTAARRFVSAYAITSRTYAAGTQVKVLIPKGTSVEGGFDKEGDSANTTGRFWQVKGGVMHVLSGTTAGYHDAVDALTDGTITLKAAEGHGGQCVKGFAGACGGQLTGALVLDADSAVIDIVSPAGEKITTPAQLKERTDAGQCAVDTYAADGKTVTALVAAARAVNFKLTVEAPENGTLTVDKQTGAVGDTVTVTAVPSDGYEVRMITVDGNAILGNTFTAFKSAHTVSAVIRQKNRHAADVTRILLIGDSHGVDSTNYLYLVAKDQGKKLVIGDLYDGSTVILDYLNDIHNNTPAFTYYKTEDGTWSTNPNTTLLTGLLDEDWDIIVLKEGASSILVSKKESLDELLAYVKEHKTNPNAEFGWFAPWRHHSTSVRANFIKSFHSDPLEMSLQQRIFLKKIADRGDFKWIIPSCTAVENASSGFIGDGLYRDDVHMNGMGRVLSSCTWYVSLFGTPIEKLGFDTTTDSYDNEAGIPDTPALTLSEEVKALIIASANAAAANPFEPTNMASYQMQEGDVVYIPGYFTAGMGCTAYVVRSATKAPGAKESVTVPVGTEVKPDSFWKLENGALVTVEGTSSAPADPVLVDVRACVLTGGEPAATKAEAVEGESVLKCFDSVVFLADASESMTRGEVVKTLYEKLGKPVTKRSAFPDVSADHKYAAAIDWAADAGVVSGYGGGKFGTEDSVTVEQLAVMLWNYAGKPDSTASAASAGTHSNWASPALRWCVEKGLLANLPNRYNFPYQNAEIVASRAQVAWMIKNYLHG